MAHEQKNQTGPEDRPGSERADIARRVANFKAHQAKLQQERDEYYKSVRARIGRTLDGSQPTNVANTPE
ncbi:hypothetical protein V4R08_04135 [Nitrobacter sp. NHB1]|uniref:hypothetical protein n=1 Tax=Nitrobacter sp. NHB1 TaxID=3119830 RepID=UPI0030000E13